MVSGGVVGWEKAEDVLCLSLYACPKMHYVMIMQGATHREARAVGGEPASSSKGSLNSSCQTNNSVFRN